MDHQHRPHVSGLIKHLWHRICKDPSHVLQLKGDLFWMPIAQQWRNVQVPSILGLVLMLDGLLPGSCAAGEWGLHLATLAAPARL